MLGVIKIHLDEAWEWKRASENAALEQRERRREGAPAAPLQLTKPPRHEILVDAVTKWLEGEDLSDTRRWWKPAAETKPRSRRHDVELTIRRKWLP